MKHPTGNENKPRGYLAPHKQYKQLKLFSSTGHVKPKQPTETHEDTLNGNGDVLPWERRI